MNSLAKQTQRYLIVSLSTYAANKRMRYLLLVAEQLSSGGLEKGKGSGQIPHIEKGSSVSSDQSANQYRN